MTTFTVAAALGVSPPTVVNWVNSGLLPAHRTPGGHRRIARTDVRAFATEHDYPLPLDFDGEGDAENPTGPSRASAALRRVLVVDDQREFCELVCDYLRLGCEYEVASANSGFEAGYAVAQFRPDVIVMDIFMPDIDGYEVLRRLRRDPETRVIPVVACTAYHDRNMKERARTEGFSAYVEKPVRLERLAQVLREVVNGRPVRS